MATLDEAIEAFGKRHSYPPAKARQEAERQIQVAVRRALAGDLTAFDQLRELEPIARQRFEDRRRAGEGQGQRFSGTTGARL